MKVLWIINIPLPPLCDKMGWDKPVIGGWLYSSFKRLLQQDDLQLFVASPYFEGFSLIDIEIDGVRYFSIPYKYRSTIKPHSYVRKYWALINDKVTPDIVHIHGTEYSYGNDFIHACGADNVVVSVQGLVSVISNYYYGGINKKEILSSITIRDILRMSTIIQNRKSFINRGIIEVDTLRHAKYVIGRTEWDKAHIWAINPKINYFYCGETLRDSFYCQKWVYENCEPYSIFISQSEYPIKGLHMVLSALPYVIRLYPRTKVYVAGNDITKSKPWYLFSGYGKYIKKIIKDLKLKNHIEFLGPLSEEQICERYLRSNLFICPSSIENSPNSLGEAQALGVPVLASYVGGIPDMMLGDESRLYRFDDVELLSYKICNIFEKGADSTPSEQISNMAKQRHSSEANLNTLLHIYQQIIEHRLGL